MLLEQLNSVLCINDSDITLFILNRTLNKANFAESVTEKKDGQEGLDYCKQLIHNNEYSKGNYPKVIFLDLHMPVMDGWKFMEKFSTEIRPFFRDTRIVITSQSIDNGDSIRAKEYPFIIDFLNQPITSAYLIKLREILLEEYSVSN